MAGHVGDDFCREVTPAPGETILRKAWPSAFRDSGLQETPATMKVEHLVMVGVWTDSCVRATVFDAVFAGFRVCWSRMLAAAEPT